MSDATSCDSNVTPTTRSETMFHEAVEKHMDQNGTLDEDEARSTASQQSAQRKPSAEPEPAVPRLRKWKRAIRSHNVIRRTFWAGITVSFLAVVANWIGLIPSLQTAAAAEESLKIESNVEDLALRSQTTEFLMFCRGLVVSSLDEILDKHLLIYVFFSSKGRIPALIVSNI